MLGMPTSFWIALTTVFAIYLMPAKFHGFWIRVNKNVQRPSGIWTTEQLSTQHQVSARYRSILGENLQTRDISCKDLPGAHATTTADINEDQRESLEEAYRSCEPTYEKIKNIVHYLTSYALNDTKENICGRYAPTGNYIQSLAYCELKLFCIWSALECVISNRERTKLMNLRSYCPQHAEYLDGVIAQHIALDRVTAMYWDFYDLVVSNLLSPIAFLL